MPEEDVAGYYFHHLNAWYGEIIILYYKYIAKYCMARPAKIKKGSKVLDIGCGIGSLVLAFNKLGYDATGIDINSEAIKKSVCAEKCFHVVDSSRLNYPDNYFDLVVSREVIEHIHLAEIDDCIKEWDRVGKGAMVHIIAVKERGPRVLHDPAHKNVQSEQWWIRKFKDYEYKVIRYPSKMYFYPFGNSGYLMMNKEY